MEGKTSGQIEGRLSKIEFHFYVTLKKKKGTKKLVNKNERKESIRGRLEGN